MVPKNVTQDQHNVRFFTQEETITLWQSGIDEQGEEYGYDYEEERIWCYDRLEDYDGFEWDGMTTAEQKAFNQSDEWDDSIDQREIVLDSILGAIWKTDPNFRNRIVQHLYASLIVYTLHEIKVEQYGIDHLSRDAGYSGAFNGFTFPNITIEANGFVKELYGWDQESHTDLFNESINYFASMKNDELWNMLLSSKIEINEVSSSTDEIKVKITLQDLFHTVSFTASINAGELSEMIFYGSLNLSGYLETSISYKINYINLFLFLKSLRSLRFDEAFELTPKWFQDWYSKGGFAGEINKSKLRRR